ncbi:MAG: precorrin-6A/cobalt-precorrin-6A reductase [Desulfonatronovibrionaceae bacterium]
MRRLKNPCPVLLIGGTSEAVQAAGWLCRAGVSVVVSNATGLPQSYPACSNLYVRRGNLDDRAMSELARQEKVRIIADLSHPYAGAVSLAARLAAERSGCRYLRYERPAVLESVPGVKWVENHIHAADFLKRETGNVLLCLGVLHLKEYARLGDSSRIYARVMPRGDSFITAARSGITPKNIICHRPQRVKTAHNLLHLMYSKARWMVTKDSGLVGGTREKLAAARMYGAGIVAIKRPAPAEPGDGYSDLRDFLSRIIDMAGSY